MSDHNPCTASPQCLESDIYQFGYPRDFTTNTMPLNKNNSPFLGTYDDDDDDDMSLLESGLYQQKYGDISDNYYRNRNKARKSSIDPRLVMLLEFFRELFIRKKEVVKKLFPEMHGEYVEMFKKIGNVLPDPVKTRALQRSLSAGSPRTPSRKGEESPLRLERFKVRTVVPGGSQGDKGGDQSGCAPSK